MSMLGPQEALSEAAPGEWEAVGRDMIRTKRTADGGGMIVAQFWTAPSPSHAAMMVAAPKILAALKELVRWHIKRGPFDEPLGASEQPPEINAALDAIAQAEPTPSIDMSKQGANPRDNHKETSK